jgi:ABC-type nitrate/sulfonate/bicarbonate transport system permease component
MSSAINTVLRLLPGIAFLAMLIGSWELAAHLKMVNTVFVPAPSAIAVTSFGLVVSGQFLPPLIHTLSLLAIGYGTGCIVAVMVGLLMGSSRAVFNLLEPLTELLRPIPKPALVPPLILFMGLGTKMEITVVALATFFPVLINTVQGVRSVDPTMIDTARTFGYDRKAIWRHIFLPASAPYILAGMRVSLAIALILVIISEMLSGTGGLGDFIINAQRSFRVKDSYAWLLILALVGVCLTWGFAWVERRLAFWSVPNIQ